MKLSDSDTPLSSICELKNQTLWFFHELCLHNYKFIFLRDLNVIVSKLFFDIHPFLICEFKQKKTNKNKTTSTLLYLKILLTYFLFIFFENQNTLKIFYNLSSLILDNKHSDMSVTFVYTFYDSLFEHCFLPISLWVLSAVPVTSPGSAGHGLRWSLQILMVLSSDRVANYQFMLKLKTSIYKSISHSFYKK